MMEYDQFHRVTLGKPNNLLGDEVRFLKEMKQSILNNEWNAAK